MHEMTNNFPEDFSQFEADLALNTSEDFESAVEDIRLKNNLARVLELEMRLRSDDAQEVDVEAEMEALDREVAHLDKGDCIVSGAVSIVSGENILLGTTVVRDFKTTFHGYGFGPADEDDDAEMRRIGYVFPVAVDSNGQAIDMETASGILAQDSSASVTFLTGVMNPEDTFEIRFPIRTPERALSWLSVMYPETLEEIDALVIAAQSYGSTGDDSRAIQALSGFELSRPQDISDETWDDYRAAVCQYTKGLLDIDGTGAYYVKYDGTVLGYDDEGAIATEVTDGAEAGWFGIQALAFLDRSMYDDQKRANGQKDGVSTFALQGFKLAKDVFENDHQMVLPIYAISELHSIRSIELSV